MVTKRGHPVARVRMRWVLDGRPALCANAQTLAEFHTDDTGHFATPSPRREGMLSVWAESGGRWCSVDWTEYPQSGIFNRGRLEVPPRDRVIRVRVNDEAGEPISDASGRLVWSIYGAPVPDTPTLHARNGLIASAPIEYGNYALDIVAAGYAPIRIMPYQFDACEKREVGVMLSPALTTKILVVRRNKRVAGAWVNWVVDYDQGNHVSSEGWWARTDSRGELTLDLPKNRPVSISVEHRGDLATRRIPATRSPGRPFVVRIE